MTKAEFIKAFKEKAGSETNAQAERDVVAFLEVVEEGLVAGETIQFVGWGSFEVKATAERIGRNPKTGEEIKIAAKKAVKFKAGKKLVEKVNG